MTRRAKRRILAGSLIALGIALLTVGGILFFNWWNTTYISINGRAVARSSETLDLTGQQQPELEAICQLTQLKQLNMTDTGITAEQYNAPGFDKTKAREYAIKEAQKATYRDFNAFSDMVNSLRFKNPKNKVQKAVNLATEAILPRLTIRPEIQRFLWRGTAGKCTTARRCRPRRR